MPKVDCEVVCPGSGASGLGIGVGVWVQGLGFRGWVWATEGDSGLSAVQFPAQKGFGVSADRQSLGYKKGLGFVFLGGFVGVLRLGSRMSWLGDLSWVWGRLEL